MIIYKEGDILGKCSFINEEERYIDPKGKKKRQATFMCFCGEIFIALIDNVKSGKTTSCGCYHKIRTSEVSRVHGKSNSAEFKSWYGMIERCTNEKNHKYGIYGGRGIKVCKRWRNSFVAFYLDMGPRPSPIHSIDRINTNGNYTKSNCKWSTPTEQARNRRNTIFLTINNIRKPFREWVEISGLKAATVWERLKRGYDVKEAFYNKL